MDSKIILTITIILVLGITGSYFVIGTDNAANSVSSGTDQNGNGSIGSAPPNGNSSGSAPLNGNGSGSAPPNGNGSQISGGAGPSGDDSANIVTNGAYVVNNTANINSFNHALGEFLRIFGVDWYDISETGKTYTSTQNDQSAIVVTGNGSISIDKAMVIKNEGNTSNADNSNFYGLNAAILTKTNSTLKLTNSNITTGVEGANGVFATGNNSKVILDNVGIITTADSSRGLDATYGGTIIANNIKITTNGAHCAALATDRGGGIVNVTNGVLNTAGDGSPGIYSTGAISATNTISTATGSEAAVIEGKNSITLTNSNITGYKKDGVMIYQSFSGDASTGEGPST